MKPHVMFWIDGNFFIDIRDMAMCFIKLNEKP